MNANENLWTGNLADLDYRELDMHVTGLKMALEEAEAERSRRYEAFAAEMRAILATEEGRSELVRLAELAAEAHLSGKE